MYQRAESEYFTAKRKAAARLGVNFRHQPEHLPSNREIRDEIQAFTRVHEGERRFERLCGMRVAALRMMRLLAGFSPRLIGSVVTGHVRAGSDIDIHLFASGASAISDVLDQEDYRYDVERKRVIKHNVARTYTHVHIHDEFEYELTVYRRDEASYAFKSSITGRAIERASIRELEELIAREHPDAVLSDEEDPGAIDHSAIWALLLGSLESVKQNPRWHPEGDALYHSLQAFEIACDEHAWDVELITAALLHDVGKAIDARDHVAAGLEALEGTLSERETFLISHHMDAQALRDGSLGRNQAARLRASQWFEDLMVLRDIDDSARECGVEVRSVEEALAHLRTLDDQAGWRS